MQDGAGHVISTRRASTQQVYCINIFICPSKEMHNSAKLRHTNSQTRAFPSEIRRREHDKPPHVEPTNQEETQILHSSDVMEVRHFTKVFIRHLIATRSRLGKQEKGIWERTSNALLASCSPNAEVGFLCIYRWRRWPETPVSQKRRCAMVFGVEEGNVLSFFDRKEVTETFEPKANVQTDGGKESPLNWHCFSR